MRIMGLDVGEKRIGIALSDELGMTAQALEVWNCQERTADIEHIHQLVQQYQVQKLVAGMPKNMDGSIGFQAQYVMDFIEDLRQKDDSLLIETWDERLSSKAAETILLQADMRRQKRKKVIDKLAAAIILQGYLDCH